MPDWPAYWTEPMTVLGVEHQIRFQIKTLHTANSRHYHHLPDVFFHD